MWNELRVGLFDEIDPARAARGKHGQRHLVLLLYRTVKINLNSLEQLVGFFHNGQVRPDERVKHVIESTRFSGPDELALAACARGTPKHFRNGHSCTGRRLEHHYLVGIRQGLHDSVRDYENMAMRLSACIIKNNRNNSNSNSSIIWTRMRTWPYGPLRE